MTTVKETPLPGVGVRHEFVTKGGDRLGTITHRSGRRDFLVYSKKDPDACARTIRLEDDDVDTIAEMLGVGLDIDREDDKMRSAIDGLTLDWLPISANWQCSGSSIADTKIFDTTGVAVVAVMRHGEPIPTPDGNFRLRAGDIAIVVGAPAAISRAQQLLESGQCGNS